MRTGGRWLLVTVAVVACSGEDVTAPPVPTARVISATATASSRNALAAFVRVAAVGADSARVLFRAVDGSLDSTPMYPLARSAAAVPVLGLRPETAYRGVVEISGAGGFARSDTVSFSSAALPELLKRITISTTGVSSGLTLTALQLAGTALLAFAFDSAGTIRWYRQFDDPRAGGELKQQPNGNFTIYIGASFGSQRTPGYYLEFTPAGDSVRAIHAPPSLYMDNHEVWVTGNSDATERIHLFAYDHRPTDLTALGGQRRADLAGHYLLRLRPNGALEFAWSGWEHLSVSDWIEPPRPGPVDVDQPDFDHPNALAFDRDSNYIVSFRNLGEIAKIDAISGEVIWRLGGANNQFTFLNDPLGGFSAQHSPKILPNGHLLVYDNGTRHQPQETRAVEYALDLPARTATMMWEFRHDPLIYTPFVGSVERLADGTTLIGYGTAGHATEVSADGGVRWEADILADGQPAFVYRVMRLGSLYRYEVP